MNLTTYEMCKHIRNIILNTTAEVVVYSWDDFFSVSEIKNTQNRIKECDWFKKVDPTDLTEDEMKNLGFLKGDEKSEILLIPLWLYPYLVDEIEGEDIFGKKEKYKTSELDLDNRFGCLSCGVKPKESN